jgi:heme-degrading monooxygenase HmoA
MPTLPWTAAATPEPGADTVVLGSRLRLRSYRDVIGFLRAAMKVRAQVRSSPGALGVSLIAQPSRKTFWTLSAWTDDAAIEEFVRTSPHREIMQRYHDRLDGASFTTWHRAGDGLPERNSTAKDLWREARERLATVEVGGGTP